MAPRAAATRAPLRRHLAPGVASSIKAQLRADVERALRRHRAEGLPVNTSGGLKARGHPLAATGISQLVELCWQLTGRAEGRQVKAHVGLAQSIGGLATNNWVTLLEGRR